LIGEKRVFNPCLAPTHGWDAKTWALDWGSEVLKIELAATGAQIESDLEMKPECVRSCMTLSCEMI
jgi:hypothetical protein